MLAKISRIFLGLLLLPLCFALCRAFCMIIPASRISVANGLWFVCGIGAFVACWFLLPRPVKTYVFGHELTHALWGLLFFAKPSRLRVGEKGGSVNLTRTNFLITLAPYFFPFYTFVVIVAALATSLFMDRLPCMPLWIFLIGFTWAFHILFTFETLARRQPDITVYGRTFSWTFIFAANALLILLWLAYAGSSFGYALSSVRVCAFDAYVWVWNGMKYLMSLLI